MTIPLTGPGGLFSRLGHIGGLLSSLNSYALTTLPPFFTNIEQQYIGTGVTDPEPDLIAPLQSALLGTQQQIGSGVIGGVLTALAQATIERMVYEDNPLITQTDLTASMKEVIRQMKAASQTVAKCNVTLATSVLATLPAMTGNGVVVGSVLNGSGLTQENTYAEVGRVTCTADAQTGGATAGNETFRFTGKFAESSILAYDWPLGSGATANLTAVSGTSNNAAGNLLNNGDFLNFTSNIPNNWVVVTGTVAKGSQANAYIGNACLQITGDGATQTALTQTFNLSTGTAAKLNPSTVYAVNCWLKMDTVPTQGVLAFELIDGNNNITQNDQGVNNTFNVNLASLAQNNTYYPLGGSSGLLLSPCFQTSHVSPATYKLRMRLSTALTSGRNLFIDHLAMSQMARLYAGGPFLTAFSGSTPFILNDTFLCTCTNDRAGNGNNNFQTLLNRLCNTASLSLLFPSASVPTIPNSLIA